MKRTIVLFLIALSPSFTAKAGHPLLGTWSGTMTDGNTIELFAAAVDPDGNSTGIVCITDGLETAIIDFGPSIYTAKGYADERDLVLPGNDKAHTLQFTPGKRNPDTARFVSRPPTPGGNALTADLVRKPERTCSRRVTPRNSLPGQENDSPRQTGSSWLGTSPGGRGFELTIYAATENGAIHGVYCELRAKRYSFYDLHSTSAGAVRAVRSEIGNITFQIRNARYTLKPSKNDESLRLVYQWDRQTHALVLNPSADRYCAGQVAELES